ncbi:type 1 glutamine amidotransferase domain-containing protein [Streptomyces sp. NPDC001339]|uniref:type 1 glutamine amidotransferase domain-containing protein n=1 Tax=Streptomyces sp. NPDC001339 TaxID=3364563 RepID=UPI0036AD0B5A
MPSVLILLSAATTLRLTDGSTRSVGFWPEELTEPHREFTHAGLDITLATPGGAPAVPDPAGFTPEGTGAPADRCDELRHAVERLQPHLKAPEPLENLTAGRFDAVFLPGGYAPMIDLYGEPACGTLLTDFHRAGKPMAAVCHAPAALLSCASPDGHWPFAGYRMTAFTDAEEEDLGLLRTLPWTAERALTQRGAHFLAGPQAWGEHIVHDRQLLTGQNPASAAPLARRLVALL